jgi:hypothetical protein
MTCDIDQDCRQTTYTLGDVPSVSVLGVVPALCLLTLPGIGLCSYLRDFPLCLGQTGCMQFL